MTATRILKGLLIATLLSCVSAHAGDAIDLDPENGKIDAPLQISDVQCKLIEGQIRCTFGSKRHG